MPLVSVPANIVTGGIIQAADILTLYSAINGNLDSANIAEGGITGLNIQDGTVGQTKMSTSFLQFGLGTVATHYSTGPGVIVYTQITVGAFGMLPLVSVDNAANTSAVIGAHFADSTPKLILNHQPSPHIDDQNNDAWGLIDISTIGSLSSGQFALVMGAGVWTSDNANSHVGSFQFNYLTASPPWNLGEGDMAFFAYALFDDATGTMIQSHLCVDPPWRRTHPGKRLFLRRSIVDAVGDPAKLEELHQDLDNPRWTSHHEAESDQAFKNAFMPAIPHPFMDVAGKTVVMIDPLSKTAERLRTLMDAGENLPMMLHKGYLQINRSQEVKRVGPPGVKIHSAHFRNTR